MTSKENLIMDTYAFTRKAALGWSYSYFRKDAVKVEELEGFRLPGKHEYMIEINVSGLSCSICQRCVRGYFVWDIVGASIYLIGFGLGLFMIFYTIDFFPEGRFVGINLSLFIFATALYSLFDLTVSKDCVAVAMKTARKESKVKGEKAYG